MANHLFEVPGGRKVGISAAGDPLALRLVVLCHPTPGAGGFDPDPLVTGRWGVHLLSIDRPGYGASEPLTEARADDFAAFINFSERTAQSVSGTDFGRIGQWFIPMSCDRVFLCPATTRLRACRAHICPRFAHTFWQDVRLRGQVLAC